jgi:hypothetical protein
MAKDVVNKSRNVSRPGIALALLFAGTAFFLRSGCREVECFFPLVASIPWFSQVASLVDHIYISLGIRVFDAGVSEELIAFVVGVLINAFILYFTVAGLQKLYRKLWHHEQTARRQAEN